MWGFLKKLKLKFSTFPDWSLFRLFEKGDNYYFFYSIRIDRTAKLSMLKVIEHTKI